MIPFQRSCNSKIPKTTCVPKKASPKSQVPSIWRLLHYFCRHVYIQSLLFEEVLNAAVDCRQAHQLWGSRLQICLTSCRRCIASSCYAHQVGKIPLGLRAPKCQGFWGFKTEDGWEVPRKYHCHHGVCSSLVHLCAEAVRFQVTVCRSVKAFLWDMKSKNSKPMHWWNLSFRPSVTSQKHLKKVTNIHRNKTVKLQECDSLFVDASFVSIFGFIQNKAKTRPWHHSPGCSCSDQPWTPKCLVKAYHLGEASFVLSTLSFVWKVEGNSSKMKACYFWSNHSHYDHWKKSVFGMGDFSRQRDMPAGKLCQKRMVRYFVVFTSATIDLPRVPFISASLSTSGKARLVSVKNFWHPPNTPNPESNNVNKK